MMSSLYIGASGMRSLGEGMAVVTNNLANQNTVGFKQSMMMYQDLISKSVIAPGNHVTNMSQSGAGVSPGENRTLFSIGGFEAGTAPTDMAINGGGFFGVSKNGETLYTRAGDFRFTKDGDLVDPTGYNVLGHALTNGVESKDIVPIKLELDPTSKTSFMNPQATSKLTEISNIGGTTSNSNNADNEFFAMVSKWDGTQDNPLGASTFSYTEPATVYDSTGKAHTLNMYYDYVGSQNGMRTYEYTAGIPPSEDAAGTGKAAGLLMAGTITFDSQGVVQGMTAFTPSGSDPSNMASWQQASLANGLPTFAANFAGAGAQNITLDLGISFPDGWNSAITSPADGNALSATKDNFYKATPGAVRTDNSITAYGTTSQSRFQKQDGYSAGELSNVSVKADGTISGSYSNGQSSDLYRVSLYRFISQDGLRREGGNHFSATEASGAAEEGKPGVQNFGTIAGNSIEQSNVDAAREFTQMIVTQRGFQMNSKVVTTSDAMLQKAMEIKR